MKQRKLLINARQAEEIRVAILESGKLFDFDIQHSHRVQQKANIYKAKVSRIEPSLNAVFVDYGRDKHGFLPLKEIAPNYLPKGMKNPSAEDLKKIFNEGQEIIIQIEKEERGNKGAAVTTYITLAGCYLVLMPNNPQAGGISRRIEGEDRQALRAMQQELVIPNGMGTIIRTACIGRSKEELQWDIDSSSKLWHAIEQAASERKAPFLIYQESDVILRTIRDYLREDITEILVDDAEAFERVKQHIAQMRPDAVDKVIHYQDEIPLFAAHKVEQQIATAYDREVRLPSGASIVIDHTEALISIDINSAKATKGGDIEETALETNLQAAKEIARQLKIRDVGGLIVIDFIDMLSNQSQRKVEDCLSQALRSDRARTQVSRISRFGLLEMSRQRLRPSLEEAISMPCPHCHGQGMIRTVETIAISLTRQIQQLLMGRDLDELQLQLPVDVATYLLNEKRELINQMEQEYNTIVIIIPNQHLKGEEVLLQRGRSKKAKASHDMVHQPEKKQAYRSQRRGKQAEQPAVQHITREAAPLAQQPKASGMWNRIYNKLFGQATPQEHAKATPAATSQPRQQGGQRRNNNQQRQRHDRQRQQRHKNDRQPQNNRQQNRPQKPRPENQAPQHHNSPKPNQAQKPVTPPPAPKTPPKPKRDMVKEVLSKKTVLSDANSQQMETQANLAVTSQPNINIDTQQFQTEFSLDAVKKAMAERESAIKMTMVKSAVKSQQPKQRKNLRITVAKA